MVWKCADIEKWKGKKPDFSRTPVETMCPPLLAYVEDEPTRTVEYWIVTGYINGYPHAKIRVITKFK